jgi:hypothetical protein
MRSSFSNRSIEEGTLSWVLRKCSTGIVAIILGFAALCWLSTPEDDETPSNPLAHVDDDGDEPATPAVNETLPDILLPPQPMEEWSDDLDVADVG